MERRHVMTGLAFAVAYPAIASAQQPAATPAPMGSTMPSGPMGDAEMQYAKRTMTAGSLSLAVSRVAVKKAEDDDVKEFAKFEVAEQETIADVLMSMKDPSTLSGTVKSPSEAEVEGNLDAKGKEMLQKMSQAKAGAAFDKEFVTAQIDGHKELLEIQENYLMTGKNREAVSVAKLARGMIKEHLTLLADLRSSLG